MKPEAKIQGWYKAIEELIQKTEQYMAYEKKVAALRNLPYSPSYITLMYYAKYKLITNEIDTAKSFYRQALDIIIGFQQSPNGIPPGFLEDYNFPFFGYFGGGQERLVEFGSMVLSNLEKWNGGSRRPSEYVIRDRTRLLVLSYCVKDKAKTDDYLRIIEADLDTNKFGADGFPTKGRAALSIGHAMYYKEMIKALMEKDQDIFTKNMNMESDWSFRFCRADDFTALPAVDLTVLYDLALGQGMRPKVATPFIPKAVLEHGYWSQI